ncbi:MAG TPA: rRNA maturation RNase YbeY [Lacipirellula sp.]
MPDLHLNGDRASNQTTPPLRVLSVVVTNETDADVNVDRVQAAARVALADSSYRDVSVSVAIVDDAAIHQLNRQFLEHDYPTDVLSFVLEDQPHRLEGEVVVSIDTANRCAEEAGWSGVDELLLYVVHGALHLVGYRDKAADEAAEMRKAEAAVLARLGVTLSAHDSRWHGADEEDDSP